MIEYQATTKMIDDNLFETTLNDQKIVLDTGSKPKQSQSPVEVLLSAIGSCSSIDVAEIIKKKRKTVGALEVKINAKRRTEPLPKLITEFNLHFILTSHDAEEKELKQAVELSVDKYCTVAGMVRSVAKVNYSWEIKRP
ncbi:MAG: OsmC family protein [Calditrichaeota bacterium]|nr:OsmC family protein [Calditrichota bacterium]